MQTLSFASLLSGVALALSSTLALAQVPAQAEEELAPILVNDESENASDDVSDAVEADYTVSTSEATLDEQTIINYNSANNYDSLRLVPGVFFLHGQGGRTGNVSRIRGVNNWTVATVIEGFPSISSTGNGAEDGGLEGNFGALIPAIALEGIEVHKGGLGVRYGAGATGGVIVNQLKKGQPGGPHGTVWLEYSPIREYLVMADIGGATDDRSFDYYVAGKYLDGEYDEVTSPDGQDLLADELASAIARLGWQPNDASRLEFIGLRGKDTVQSLRAPEANDPQRIRSQTNNATTFAGLKWEQAVDKALSYSLSYSYWHTDAERLNLSQSTPMRLRPQRSQTVAADIFYRTELTPQWRYSGSAGVESTDHQQREEVPGREKEQNFVNRSIYSANSFIYDERLFLTAGLRVGASESDLRSDNGTAYDLGVAYRFADPETLLRANYSTSYYRNKGFVFFFGPIEEAGGIKLAETETIEIGIEQPLPRQGRVGLTLFRIDTDNAPLFSGWGAGEVYYRNTRAQGVEVYGDYWLQENLQAAFSYTHIDTDILDSTHPNPSRIGETSVPVPATTASVALRWYVSKKLWFDTMAVYDSGQRTETIDETTGALTVTEQASFVRWNLTANYTVTPQFNLFARAENLLDEENLGYTQQTSSPSGTSTSELVGDDPGRFVAVGLRYEW
ncbi:MAG TPA: TonB-dependent receptor plug domain-containing protein [Gammaproteobacteria bacterium]|nr:TonB-dependent receptor plug domain-containing protein [Gammaproteobacteria bacterium]